MDYEAGPWRKVWHDVEEGRRMIECDDQACTDLAHTAPVLAHCLGCGKTANTDGSRVKDVCDACKSTGQRSAEPRYRTVGPKMSVCLWCGERVPTHDSAKGMHEASRKHVAVLRAQGIEVGMLVAVAIRFQGKIWSLPKPNRHHDVRNLIIAETGVEAVDVDHDWDQGFLDEAGRYYHRKAAWVHAANEGQLIREPTGNVLTSEDLW